MTGEGFADMGLVASGERAVHYIAMMVFVAGISLYGSGGAKDLRLSYQAATAGEFGEAIGFVTAGLRRALREADTGRSTRELNRDTRQHSEPSFMSNASR